MEFPVLWSGLISFMHVFANGLIAAASGACISWCPISPTDNPQITYLQGAFEYSNSKCYGKPYCTKVVEIFLFKSRFFLQVKNSFSRWGFQYSSRDLFYSSWDVSSGDFFPCRDFYLKARIFSHVEIFIASREFFFLSRIFSCQGISVQVEIFFLCRDLSIQVDIFQFKARVEILVGISRLR